MKTLKISLLVSAAVFAIACSKDEAPKPSINGLWIGKYGSASTYPAQGYAFLFRPNGTVRVFNNVDTTLAAKGEGTYAILGSTITTNYTYIENGAGVYSTSAKVNENFTFMEGTWGSGTNITNGGKFFIYK